LARYWRIVRGKWVHRIYAVTGIGQLPYHSREGGKGIINRGGGWARHEKLGWEKEMAALRGKRRNWRKGNAIWGN